jgi:hypothetical protein
MILIQCKNEECSHAFELMSVRTKKGVMYNLKDEQIICELCSSEDVERIFTQANEGLPEIGRYSATNEYNRKR